MNSKIQSMTAVFLFLVIFIGVFICAHQIYTTNKELDSAHAKITKHAIFPNTKNVTSLKKEIDTSEWKTYENTQYGFSFIYPHDWTVTEDYHATTPLADVVAVTTAPQKSDSKNKNLLFDVLVSSSAKGTNPKKWYQKTYENPDIIKGYKGETKELQINELDAYYVVEDKGVYKNIKYIISKNNLMVYSSFRYDNKSKNFSYPEYIPVFNAMVFSFK